MKEEAQIIITPRKGMFFAEVGGNEERAVVMQIDGNWKLCQALKSVSPIRLGGQFRFKCQFYSVSVRHSTGT